jgi:hypothetical protein
VIDTLATNVSNVRAILAIDDSDAAVQAKREA